MSQVFSTLIDADTLAQYIDAPDWRIFDCRFDLQDKGAGRRWYGEAHLSHALYADLEHDLSGPHTTGSGRHPLPDAGALAARFCEWGIDADTQLVAYDGQSGALASRFWWLSRWLGHRRVAVLNGGFAAWQAAGYATDTAIPAVSPTNFVARPDDALWVSTASLQQRLADNAVLLIDAREEARFRGEVEPLDRLAGHIPGALNRPFEWNLDADGKFLTPDELQAGFSQIATDIAAKNIVHSCGSGVTACHNILAMEIIGLTGSLLYPGSWSEWITDPNRPVISQKEA